MSKKTLEQTDAMLQSLAAGLDNVLNGAARGKDRKNAFVLLVTPFDSIHTVNYVSNAERDDIIAMMRGVVERFDAMKKMATPSAN